MIVHSFVTDGYFDFAVGMLKSFKLHHGTNIPFILHSKDLVIEQQEKLHGIYPNLKICNTATDWDWIVTNSGCPLKVIEEGKHRVEDLTAKYNHTGFAHWKHYISIYERYKRALSELFEMADEDEHILHLDIDMYVNKNFDAIFNMIRHADVCILLRPGAQLEWRKTFGCILGFTVNDNSRYFLKRYHEIINTIPFNKIPKGWGQTALWRAYLSVKDNKNIKIADIPTGWISKGFDNRAYLFAAHLGKPKTTVAQIYKGMADKRTNLPPEGEVFRKPRDEKTGAPPKKAWVPNPVRRKKNPRKGTPRRKSKPRPTSRGVVKLRPATTRRKR